MSKQTQSAELDQLQAKARRENERRAREAAARRLAEHVKLRTPHTEHYCACPDSTTPCLYCDARLILGNTAHNDQESNK